MSQRKTPDEYLKLAAHYARERERAAETSKGRLFEIEQGYLVLAQSAYVLERAEKVSRNQLRIGE
jgi:hypothetical protein